MKYISKQAQPQELIAWIHAKATDDQGLPLGWGYDDMPAAVRQAVKVSLIQEQGALCCYTGRRISANTSHIEHLKPQCECVDHEDTEYTNLLAAYPSSEPGTPRCSYGAHVKEDWYDAHLFVHPLRPDCEKRFRYRSSGKITPANPQDRGAEATIQRLGLNDPQIVQLRKAAIDSALYAEELTKTQAQRLLKELDRRDGDRNYREFCFVIKQACEKYIRVRQ